MGYAGRAFAHLATLGVPTEKHLAYTKAIEYIDLTAGDELSNAVQQYMGFPPHSTEEDGRCAMIGEISAVIDKLHAAIRVLKGTDLEMLDAADPGCKVCGRDNRNATHTALEMTGHLNHSFQV